MDYDFDAIVVGARCAGASTAMLLARHGHRVLLVDRARFPSDIPHGHFIHRHGPRRLAGWGLLDAIQASGCPRVTSMTSTFGDLPLVANDLEIDGVAWGYGPPRTVLDKILVDAATDSGAELRQEFPVDELLFDGDRVVGIRSGSTRATAPLVIGADGRHSRVAGAVDAPAYEQVPTLTCWYFAYFRDVPAACMEMHVLPERRAVFTFPTNDDLLAIFVGWPVDEFPQVRAEVERSFLGVLDLAPGLGERVRNGRRVERLRGTADMPNFLRKPFGDGWALVGDAGCHKDPFLAMGICDALRDAELLADAAHRGLSGDLPLQAALAEYQQQRDAASLADYRQNVDMARFGPIPPDVLQLRLALHDKPVDTTRFVMASHHMIPPEEFFNPHNLQRILSAAPRAVAA